jgi:hypothetical protein
VSWHMEAKLNREQYLAPMQQICMYKSVEARNAGSRINSFCIVLHQKYRESESEGMRTILE